MAGRGTSRAVCMPDPRLVTVRKKKDHRIEQTFALEPLVAMTRVDDGQKTLFIGNFQDMNAAWQFLSEGGWEVVLDKHLDT